MIFGHNRTVLLTVGDIAAQGTKGGKKAKRVTFTEDPPAPINSKSNAPVKPVVPRQNAPVEPAVLHQNAPVAPVALGQNAPTWTYRIIDNNDSELRARQLQNGLDEDLPEIALQRHVGPSMMGNVNPQFDTLQIEEVDVGDYETPTDAPKIYRTSNDALKRYRHHRNDIRAPPPPLAFPAYTAAQPRYVSPPPQVVFNHHAAQVANRPIIAPSVFYNSHPVPPSSRALQGGHQQPMRVPPVARSTRHPVSNAPPPQIRDTHYPAPGTTRYFDYSEGAAGPSGSTHYP